MGRIPVREPVDTLSSILLTGVIVAVWVAVQHLHTQRVDGISKPLTVHRRINTELHPVGDGLRERVHRY